jgi:hypothetical protein
LTALLYMSLPPGGLGLFGSMFVLAGVLARAD